MTKYVGLDYAEVVSIAVNDSKDVVELLEEYDKVKHSRLQEGSGDPDLLVRDFVDFLAGEKKIPATMDYDPHEKVDWMILFP